MALLKVLKSITRRVLRGEDIILVPQERALWDRQFASGAWDRLLQADPNIVQIAQRIIETSKKNRIRVLDVGCGNGALGVALDDTVEYWGIDFSEEALRKAKEVVPSGHFILADVALPPDTLQSFDIIVFSEILYYVDPRIVIPLYAPYLTPEGKMIISVFRFWRSFFIWQRIRSVLTLSQATRVRDSSSRRSWDIQDGRFR